MTSGDGSGEKGSGKSDTGARVGRIGGRSLGSTESRSMKMGCIERLCG